MTNTFQAINIVTLLIFLSRGSQSEFLSFNKTSFIETHPLDLKRQFTLSFRTCEGGSLLYQTNGDSFFELKVLPGNVHNTTFTFTNSTLAVTWKIAGDQNTSVLHVGSQLDQNKPYQIVYAPNTNNVTISISLGSDKSYLNVPGTIFTISGGNLTLGKGFDGCIDFGEQFEIFSAHTNVGTSSNCTLENGKRCPIKVCLPGFKGYYCEVNINECASLPCHHASTCVDGINNYTCVCGVAWEGRNCDNLKNETICDSKPCENGGLCQILPNFNNYTCSCLLPYTGRNCSEILDPCRSMPCQNSGSCKPLREIDFYCDCADDYAGKRCEKNIDDCAQADCGHGRCVDGVNNHSCDCTGSGYTGSHCMEDINECNANPCQNGGTCQNFAGGFLCSCKLGHLGKFCNESFDHCASNPCVNGTCSNVNGNYNCSCNSGWEGRNCSDDIDECDKNIDTCNKTTSDCSNTMGGFKCDCHTGYAGVNCTDIDECKSSSACNGQGQCKNTDGSFECLTCKNGFTGKRCEINVDDCIDQTDPNRREFCVNGKCIDGVNSYTCVCNRGWTGTNCDVDIDECKLDICQNNGMCNNTVGDYTCTCLRGYDGKNCSNDIDDCVACNVSGTNDCKDMLNNYTCYCNQRYQGRNCSDDVDECLKYRPCQNNGSCMNLFGGYNCTCDPSYSGVNCTKLIDPCTVLMPCQNNGSCTVTPDYNYTCSCADGFAGTNCTNSTTLGFDGTSSLAVTVNEPPSSVSLSFQTIVPEGVLISQSSSWIVFLQSGQIELSWAESCTINSPSGFADSNWHQVIVFINSSTVTVQVDSDQSCSVPTVGEVSSRKKRDTSSQFVVGAGDSDRSGFIGSIRDLSFDNMKFYPGVAGLNTSNVATAFQRQPVCSPDPCVNGTCLDLWTRYSCECERYWTGINCTEAVEWGTFGVIKQLKNGFRPNNNSNNSFASYSLTTALFNHLVFTVRTRSTSSLIIRLKYNNTKYLSIVTDDSGLLRLRDGSDFVDSKPGDNFKINDGVAHYIYLNSTTLQVDDVSRNVTITSLRVNHVFVGGLREGEVSATHEQFRGCLRDVRVNRNQLLFNEQNGSAFSYMDENVATGCHGEDVCNVSGSSPCSGPGNNCTDIWNDFECACQLPYGGKTCELYGCEWRNFCQGNATCVNLRDTDEYECINEATFNQSQSPVRFKNSSRLSDIKSLVVQFRTRQNNTVILSSVYNAWYFMITIQAGSVMVTYNLSGNTTGIVDTDSSVSDGNWRELKIESTQSVTHFNISSLDSDHFSHTSYQSSHQNISLLGETFTDLVATGGVYIGSSSMNDVSDKFIGCVREVRFGEHLLNFLKNDVSMVTTPGFTQAQSAFTSVNLSHIQIGCHGSDVCRDSPCRNGTCVDTWNDFYCECQTGQQGARCEIDACSSSPCVNGTCTVRGSMFECTCHSEYVGTLCNETCSEDFCRNGGRCVIAAMKRTCTCEPDWTGELCESSIPRDEDNDYLPLIIGVSVGAVVFILFVIAIVCICTRETSSTFGVYSPSGEEKTGARVEMKTVMNVPPPEILI